MSKKYYDRLLVGTGSTNKKVQSKFGEMLMSKMGWKDGEGLGKTMQGMTDCIQIKRRDENLGMGAEMETVGAKFKWNDQFWDDTYNQAAAKFSATAPKSNGKRADNHFDKKIKIGNSTSSSDDDSDDSDKKNNQESDSDDSSVSSFDGDIVIEKSSKKLLKMPTKDKKEKNADKLSKSKSIKKDKKKSKK